jgi:hypothetical protein
MSADWESLVKRSDVPSKREDLRPRNPQSRRRHVTARDLRRIDSPCGDAEDSLE